MSRRSRPRNIGLSAAFQRRGGRKRGRRRRWRGNSSSRLSERTLPTERELVSNMERVVRVTARLGSGPACRHPALCRAHVLRHAALPIQRQPQGLAAFERSGRYCYYVAGVVGEMLTDLFCDYSAEIARHRPRA